jgi:glycerophosphoryl diester phosphodiesterase
MLVFGHRGARGEAPENTLPGFAHAYAAGVRAFELDVRLSADDQLVVIHDATVDRTTNATGSVANFSAASLSRLDARAAHPAWPETAGVPRLVDVLAAYAGQVRFAIEIKTDTPERLERVATHLVRHVDHYAIGTRVTFTSFDSLALENVRRLAPDVPRGFIGAFDTPSFLETALRLECRQADMPVAKASAGEVRRAHEHGLHVVGWQGNTPQDIETLLEWGVDGITSDYPTRALAYLTRRGVKLQEDWT